MVDFAKLLAAQGDPLVYYDLETGGTEMAHPVIQIAAIAVRQGREIASFETKIQFDLEQCDPAALELVGYSPERWANAVDKQSACANLAQFLGRFKCLPKVSKTSGKHYKVAQLAAYNGAVFDQPRLREFFADEFLPTDPRCLDVLQLVMWFFDIWREEKPHDFKLATVAAFFNIPLSGAHDALNDVRATVRIGEIIRARLALGISKLNVWSIDTCMARLRRVQAECIEKNSAEPVRKFFDGLNSYGKNIFSDPNRDANCQRMYRLWFAHFDDWYTAFTEGSKGDQTNLQQLHGSQNRR